MRTNQPQHPKPKRETDTSPYVGHLCRVCNKPVAVSKGSGYWRFDPSTGTVVAFHLSCVLESHA